MNAIRLNRPEIDLGRLNLPQLTEMLHRIADEIQLREMELETDSRCVCCGRIIPEGRQICPVCEKNGTEVVG